MSERDDGYLWDRSGPVDPDVEALERMLGRYAFDERRRPTTAPRRSRRTLMTLAAALLAVAVGTVVWTIVDDPRSRVRLVSDARPLEPGDWIESGGELRLWLGDGEIGELRLAEGGRLQVRELDDDRALLFLERGSLHAFVGPDARPRFFQVETPVAVCVDLGCRYELTVDEATGDAHVVVTLGQVAFETERGAVFVPRGAEATVTRAHGPGTPRFADASDELAAALDDYDRAPTRADRIQAAEVVAEIADASPDTLPLWHMLATGGPKVRDIAEAALSRIAGPPPSKDASPEQWRAHLDWRWWR